MCYEVTLIDIPVTIVNSKHAIFQFLRQPYGKGRQREPHLDTRARTGPSIGRVMSVILHLSDVRRWRSYAFFAFCPPIIRGTEFHPHGIL